MNNSPEITRNGIVSVLSISPMEEDHFFLQDILHRLQGTLDPSRTFTANFCAPLASALAALQQCQFEVVVCERDLPPGSWKDVLEQVTILSDPPSLIVTSRLADERLWAEALNLGAYDVLAKPLTERKRCGSLVQRGEHGAGRCGSQRGKNAINVKSLPLAERHEAAHSLGSWHSEILQTATLSARFEVGA